jgi:hypothetical protein
MKRSSPPIKTRLTAYIPILTPHASDFRADEFWELLEDLPHLSGKLNLLDFEAATPASELGSVDRLELGHEKRLAW